MPALPRFSMEPADLIDTLHQMSGKSMLNKFEERMSAIEPLLNVISAFDRASKVLARLTIEEWELVKLQEDRRRYALSGDQLAAVFGMLSAP
jgi:hypothetical protein